MIHQALNPGTILNGNFRIERVLGRGGFGITYLATDLSLERTVAIKEFFPKDFCSREENTTLIDLGNSATWTLVNQLKAKFLKEARNIAKLSHPNIIKIYAAFEANNTAYYVMEYVPGKSLYELICETGPMKPDEAVSVIEKIGGALEYVHELKINHLDVKPGNILWNPATRTPVLIDFGLSKQYDREGNQTSSTPVGVSNGYAPIEQYQVNGVHEFAPQTDLYALGATLYFLVSGKRPPEAMVLLNENLTFDKGFPEALKAPIRKAMSPRRVDRHSSVSEFLASLKEPDTVYIDFDDTNPVQHVPQKPVEQKTSVEPLKTDLPKKPDESKRGSGTSIFVVILLLTLLIIVVCFIASSSGDRDSDNYAVDTVAAVRQTPAVEYYYPVEEAAPEAEELFAVESVELAPADSAQW